MFNKGNKKPRFGPKRESAPREFGTGTFGRDREMHKAVCSTCGEACELPFKPKDARRVYCKACFGRTDRAPERKFGSDSFPRRGDAPREGRDAQLEMINTKLDKILKLLAAFVIEDEGFDDDEEEEEPREKRRSKKR